MKLAHALTARSDLVKRISSLRSRAVENLRADEDGTTPEAPTRLIEEALEDASRLEALVRAINHTNSATPFNSHGVTGTLTDALARRDALASQHKTLSDVLSSISGARSRRIFDDRPAGKLVVDTSQLRAQADSLAHTLRELDLAIQGLNWGTDLIEA